VERDPTEDAHRRVSDRAGNPHACETVSWDEYEVEDHDHPEAHRPHSPSGPCLPEPCEDP